MKDPTFTTKTTITIEEAIEELEVEDILISGCLLNQPENT